MMRRHAMAFVAAFVVTFTILVSCVNDNTEIRAQSETVFRYTHWSHDGVKGTDSADLHFINQTTGEEMTWKGDVRDAMVYLEQIDKGQCYKHPIDKWKAEKVPCG